MHKMDFTLLNLLILFAVNPIIGLQLTNLHVPRIVDFRNSITLSCSYEMGNHILNSVKWYKDGKEFFRYSPLMFPPISKFDATGISLAKYDCNNTISNIILDQLNPRTSGAYRCEISGDRPEFKLASQTANMTIVAKSQKDPDINGLKSHYGYREFVMANCTADKSSPPAMLTWYINGEELTQDDMQPMQETVVLSNEFPLTYRSREVRFSISRERFPTNKIDLRCVATQEPYKELIRERNSSIIISSPDDIRNQDIYPANWFNFNSGQSQAASQHNIFKISLASLGILKILLF